MNFYIQIANYYVFLLLIRKYMRAKRFTIIFLIVTALLSIPLIAMQFTDEVQWSSMDFLVMGVLLLVTALGIDWAIRKAGKMKVIVSLFLILLFLLIWAELAVGLFGSPFAGS